MLLHTDSPSAGQQGRLSAATQYLLYYFFCLECFSPRPLHGCFLPIMWSQLKWPPPQTCLTPMSRLILSVNIPLVTII